MESLLEPRSRRQASPVGELVPSELLGWLATEPLAILTKSLSVKMQSLAVQIYAGPSLRASGLRHFLWH